jgi:hypothetical protein
MVALTPVSWSTGKLGLSAVIPCAATHRFTPFQICFDTSYGPFTDSCQLCA